MFSLGSWLAWGWALLDALLQGEIPPRVAWGQPGDSPGDTGDPLLPFPAGLVGACAVSVLCSLLKVYTYIQCVK